MKLLDLKTTKKVRDNESEERLKNSRKIMELEKNLVTSLNKIKDNVDIEKKRVKTELKDYKKKAKLKIDDLKREVGELESRKRDALKPIYKLSKEAELKMEQAIEKEKQIKDRENNVKKKEDALLDKIDSLSDREQIIEEKEADLISRVKKVKASEESNKQSIKKINTAWVKFYKDVDEAQKKINIREKNVNAKEMALKYYRESLENREKIWEKKKKAIQDGYATLNRAWKEFNYNKQKHG